MKKDPELLLIATNARILIESAIRGGYSAVVIDGFCDREVRQHAVSATRVALRREGGLDDDALAEAIMQTGKQYAETLKTLVVGSGIEGCKTSLEVMRQSGMQRHGNQYEYRRYSENKTLERLPDQMMSMPDNMPPYLYKSVIGSGGVHIYRDDDYRDIKQDYYRQSYLPLTSISHLFLADGNQIETVGFSVQWHSKHDPRHPFCYGGAIGTHSLDQSCTTQAEAIAEKSDLIGLNNIDYLYDGTGLYFLELNPRPGATMTLYDEDYADGLLHAHIKACEGEGLPRHSKVASACRTFAIIYTDEAIRLPNDFEWPIEARDIPVENPAGYYFEKNAPVCTLHVKANDIGSALTRLQNRIRDLQKRIAQISKTNQFYNK